MINIDAIILILAAVSFAAGYAIGRIKGIK